MLGLGEGPVGVYLGARKGHCQRRRGPTGSVFTSGFGKGTVRRRSCLHRRSWCGQRSCLGSERSPSDRRRRSCRGLERAQRRSCRCSERAPSASVYGLGGRRRAEALRGATWMLASDRRRILYGPGDKWKRWRFHCTCITAESDMVHIRPQSLQALRRAGGGVWVGRSIRSGQLAGAANASPLWAILSS